MKRITLIFTAVISIFVCVGCSDDCSDLNSNATQVNDLKEQDLLTRANEGFDTNWENMTEVTLTDGQKLKLPWDYNGGSPSKYEIRKDVRKEDGWIMLSHSINQPIYLNVPVKYIALYNQASGDIKIFLFPFNSTLTHNTALWMVYFTKPQSWMNSLNEVSLPTTYKFKPDFLWQTCIKTTSDKTMIENGWNILLIPDIAYDPNPPGEIGIQIDSKSYTTTWANLFGDTEGDINGKLISTGYKNPTDDFKSEVVSYTGDAAESFAKKILKVESTRAIGGIIASGVGSLIAAGANKILSGFLGKFSKPTYSETNVRLKLKSSTNITGKLITPSPTGFPSTGFQIGNDSTGILLGAWNLTENPTIYIHPVGIISRVFYNNSDDALYRFAASGKSKTDIVINPQLRPHIIKYSVDCDVVKYVRNGGDFSDFPQIPVADYSYSDFGPIGAERGDGSYMDDYDRSYLIFGSGKYSILDDRARGLVYYWKFWENHGKYTSDRPHYKYVYAPDNKNLCRSGNIKIGCNNYYAKVMVTMVTEFEGKRDTIVSSRTYKPKFDWDPDLVKMYSGRTMKGVQDIAKTDNLLKIIDDGYYDNVLYSKTPPGQIHNVGEEEEE